MEMAVNALAYAMCERELPRALPQQISPGFAPKPVHEPVRQYDDPYEKLMTKWANPPIEFKHDSSDQFRRPAEWQDRDRAEWNAYSDLYGYADRQTNAPLRVEEAAEKLLQSINDIGHVVPGYEFNGGVYRENTDYTVLSNKMREATQSWKTNPELRDALQLIRDWEEAAGYRSGHINEGHVPGWNDENYL